MLEAIPEAVRELYAHGVRAAIDEAKKAESAGEEKCILVNISRHGFLDLDAYGSKVRFR
jgi:tryptophan synthase beta chain